MDPDYYENEQNIANYAQFTPAHDGALLIEQLVEHLPRGATVLELGMGPGKDLEKLAEHFQVTGSDFSRAFLDRYRKLNAAADLLHLDARTIDTDRHFDAIYSNKALIHFSPDELRQCFNRQHAVLNEAGLILHSFWYGEGQADFNDLTLVYHNEKDLADMLSGRFDILAMERHAKMKEGDSIYVLASKSL
jgi:cyclopropane fatty-acyl-phospholipid synthase-like methyltransferase